MPSINSAVFARCEPGNSERHNAVNVVILYLSACGTVPTVTPTVASGSVGVSPGGLANTGMLSTNDRD